MRAMQVDLVFVELKLQHLTDRTILRRDVVPGGHDWPAWLRLRENFLETRIPPGRAPT